ncbi:MAG TPA: sigma-54 dependent transcriptional regulator [Alphaproteobacteria bacterium]|nr:sigma-54 dependent transcriptional regulator [Alphaproteobacteria bacterium]HNS45151.1 sigma-54 dependent transcriptional regulator [Alphaproteobacteria bacterium]
MSKANILIVDDEADIRSLIVGILEDEGYGTGQAENAAQVYDALGKKNYSLVVLDIWLKNSEYDGLGILEKIKQSYPDLPVVMISGHGTIETAVKAIKIGAYDFIEKPFKTDRLLLMIDRALEAAALRRENAALKVQNERITELVGPSQVFQSLVATLDKIAPTNSRVMITGASGSGKEAVAHYIHKNSSRANASFVAVNCATLTPDSLEEKLFGIEQSGKIVPGLLERANGGTLLLDEVADLPMETQGKILRVLQEQSFTPLGGQMPVKVDVRVMASTAQSLEDKIESGEFREDLFYRLNVVPVQIPRLQDRKEDIPTLFDYFMTEISKNSKGSVLRPLSDGALVALQSYVWPGNVRQLKNLVEWVMATACQNGASDEPIQASDLPQEITQFVHASLKGDWETDMISLPLREAREVFEREYLLAQITRFNGNISRTAQFVGMERSALHRKLKSLHITTSEREEREENGEQSPYDRSLKTATA